MSELFASTHAALVFAYNYVAQPPPGPIGQLYRAPGEHNIGSGKGLVGLDGAAQAGMVLNEVRELGPGSAHILTARFAPRTRPCACRAPCCVGQVRTPRWEEAIRFMTEQALGQLSGCVSNYRLRRGVICRYFGERVNMSELAEHAGCNRDTASDQNARLATWLRKEEARALHDIDQRLKSAGMVGR